MTWTTLSYAFGSVLTSTKMTQLYDNITAFANKDSGAPALANDYVVTAMMAAANVTQSKIASSAVGQSQLKTATNSISGITGQGQSVLSGGRYCFLPTETLNAGAGSDAVAASITAAIDTADVKLGYFSGLASSTRSSELTLLDYYFSGNDGGTIIVQYVSASPPYNPFGLGDHLLFVYGLVDKSSGRIVIIWIAEDPPWANNGPTPVNPLRRIEKLNKIADPFANPMAMPSDFEEYFAELKMLWKNLGDGIMTPEMLPPITQVEKNADMDLIPHPLPCDTDRYHVVLLAGDIVENLWMRQKYSGDSVPEILLNGHLVVDNTPIIGATKYPRDCLLIPARFKHSKK